MCFPPTVRLNTRNSHEIGRNAAYPSIMRAMDRDQRAVTMRKTATIITAPELMALKNSQW